MYRVGTCSYGLVVQDNCLSYYSPVSVPGYSGDRCMCA
jgi:hypothetical protein